MIWDNFSIFRTNCGILTSYIRANPRTCRGFTRVCCHVGWSKMMRVLRSSSSADFSQRWQGIRQESKPGLFYALLCSELMEKVSLSGSKISLISRFQWIISARACCTRKLLRVSSKKTLHSGIELVSEFPKQCVVITKALFCRVSYCFCLFGEFAKVFERQVWCVRVRSSFA